MQISQRSIVPGWLLPRYFRCRQQTRLSPSVCLSVSSVFFCGSSWGKWDTALTHSNNKITVNFYLSNKGGLLMASAFPCDWIGPFKNPLRPTLHTHQLTSAARPSGWIVSLCSQHVLHLLMSRKQKMFITPQKTVRYDLLWTSCDHFMHPPRQFFLAYLESVHSGRLITWS